MVYTKRTRVGGSQYISMYLSNTILVHHLTTYNSEQQFISSKRPAMFLAEYSVVKIQHYTSLFK